MPEQKMKIIVIEDDRLQAEDLKEQLEEFGYMVIGPAFESIKAIHLFKKYRPDLALVDITLKNSPLDGVHLAERFIKIRKTPVIFITGNSDEQTKQKVKKIVPNNYLVKPVSAEQLDVAIDFALYDFMRQQGIEENHNGIYQPYNDTKEYIFIKHNINYVKINPREILYLNTAESVTEIILEYNRYFISSTLTEVLKKINSEFIVRTNRSNAVNIHKILSFSKTNINIVDKNSIVKIPLSSNYKNNFLSKIRIIKTS